MSEVKVNKISPRSGTTVTLGDSGDTFTIPSGATINNQGTATNFGATGAASWTTTVKTNSDSGFTAVSGEGYFLNTTSGTISVNLPAGTAGAIVGFKDYAKTWDDNNVTLVQNGSDKIGGSTVNAKLQTEGAAVTLVFIDSVQGWLVTDDGLQSQASTAQFVTATGGTITTVCTNFKVHTFTGPGTFCVSDGGNVAGSNEISYLVVAGGGGGSANGGGGGGAGGYREGKSPQTPYTASPLACTSGTNNGLPVAAATYPVTVGGGGPGVSSGRSTDGSVSTFAGTTTITSAGGGGSGTYCGSVAPCNAAVIGANGGSGGGGGGGTSVPSISCIPSSNKGTGNTPVVSPSQGNPGGRGMHSGSYSPTGAVGGGGGGGAGGPGGEPVLSPGKGGTGGVGTPTQITGSAVSYAGGAGGGIGPGTGFTIPAGSPCGTGGAGGRYPGTDAIAGTTNRGGGGGGGGHQPQAGQNGGPGVVIIRYKFQ